MSEFLWLKAQHCEIPRLVGLHLFLKKGWVFLPILPSLEPCIAMTKGSIWPLCPQTKLCACSQATNGDGTEVSQVSAARIKQQQTRKQHQYKLNTPVCVASEKGSKGQMPTARHFSFEKINHFRIQYRDNDGLAVQTTRQTSRKRISAAVFGLSVFSYLCWIFLSCSSTIPDSSQFCLGEGTSTLWSLRAMWALGTTLKHVPKQASSKADWWAKTPPEEDCCQPQKVW